MTEHMCFTHLECPSLWDLYYIIHFSVDCSFHHTSGNFLTVLHCPWLCSVRTAGRFNTSGICWSGTWAASGNANTYGSVYTSAEPRGAMASAVAPVARMYFLHVLYTNVEGSLGYISGFFTTFTQKYLGRVTSNVSTCESSATALMLNIIQVMLFYGMIYAFRLKVSHCSSLLQGFFRHNVLVIQICDMAWQNASVYSFGNNFWWFWEKLTITSIAV